TPPCPGRPPARRPRTSPAPRRPRATAHRPRRRPRPRRGRTDGRRAGRPRRTPPRRTLPRLPARPAENPRRRPVGNRPAAASGARRALRSPPFHHDSLRPPGSHDHHRSDDHDRCDLDREPPVRHPSTDLFGMHPSVGRAVPVPPQRDRDPAMSTARRSAPACRRTPSTAAAPAVLPRRAPLPAGHPDPVLDVVVPVHNEEDDLEPCVRRLHTHLTETFPYAFRITVADNASTDRTPVIAARLAHELPGTDWIRLAAKGRGRALHAAWTRSRAPVLAYLDVDLSTDLAALLPLVAPLISGHSDV